MNAIHICFRTDRFNLSVVGDDFINPCCFGEDLAEWLRLKLSERGVTAHKPYQEDWGWELPVSYGEDSYYLGIGGNSDGLAPNKNEGEWRVIVEKQRTLWQKLVGKGEIKNDDPILLMVTRILSAEASINNLRQEDDLSPQGRGNR
jgi:hypothetical protein